MQGSLRHCIPSSHRTKSSNLALQVYEGDVSHVKKYKYFITANCMLQLPVDYSRCLVTVLGLKAIQL